MWPSVGLRVRTDSEGHILIAHDTSAMELTFLKYATSVCSSVLLGSNVWESHIAYHGFHFVLLSFPVERVSSDFYCSPAQCSLSWIFPSKLAVPHASCSVIVAPHGLASLLVSVFFNSSEY